MEIPSMAITIVVLSDQVFGCTPAMTPAGIPMIIATQRPETSAISPKVSSQATSWFIHQLGSQSNIKTVSDNLVSSFPESVNDGKK